jgi:hypothetical protein
MSVDNKTFIKKSQFRLQRLGIEVKTTLLYEMYSKIIGEKSYNVALSKGLNFLKHFIKTNEIATGVKYLNLPPEGITSIFSGDNVGKTSMCVNIGANALKATDDKGQNIGLKVLHVNTGGSVNKLIEKYLSNITQFSYEDILKGNLNKDEIIQFEKTQDNCFDRLRIINVSDFSLTIEELDNRISDVFKTFKFDVLIIDLPQLLDTKINGYHDQEFLENVMRRISSLTHECYCSTVCSFSVDRHNENNLTVSRYSDIELFISLNNENIGKSFNIKVRHSRIPELSNYNSILEVDYKTFTFVKLNNQYISYETPPAHLIKKDVFIKKVLEYLTESGITIDEKTATEFADFVYYRHGYK